MNTTNSKVMLVVHRAETADDVRAIQLVKTQFEEIEIFKREGCPDEPLPALWTREACYSGIGRITSFINMMSRFQEIAHQAGS